MAKVTEEKIRNDFSKNYVIEFAMKNLKRRDPASNYKKEKVEDLVNEEILRLIERDSGITPVELGAKLANLFGEVPSHFSFDGHRPFTTAELKKYNLEAKSEADINKELGKRRLIEKKADKKEWEAKRRKERDLFRRYFDNWLKETRGEHKENKLGVKVMVGEDIEIKRGHYHKIY
jgi:hypothetical protein